MNLPIMGLVVWAGILTSGPDSPFPVYEPPRTVAHYAEIDVSPEERWARPFSWVRNPYVHAVRLDVDHRGRFVVSGAHGTPTSRPEMLRSSEHPPSSISIDARRSLSTIPGIHLDIEPGVVRRVHMLAHANATVVLIRYVSSFHPHHGERWRDIALHLRTDGSWVSTEFTHHGPGVLLEGGTVIVTPRRGETTSGAGVRVRGAARLSPRGVLTRFPIRFRSMAAFGDQLWGIQRRGFRDHLLNTTNRGTILTRVTLPRRWRASTPMPSAAGPCVLLSRGDSHRLACFDPAGSARYDLAIPEDTTCLHDAAGRMYLGSPREARITALDSEGLKNWEISAPLTSNFVATAEGELCWVESAATTPQLTCLGRSKALVQPSTRSVRINASPTEAR